MIYVTKKIAAKMEACIKQSHIEVTKQYTHGKILEINGGAACFSGFDSYLSQVVGWGFSTKLKNFKAEIESIEHFYAALNHTRVDIELCPFVGNDLAVLLSQRGYELTELNNVSVLDLNIISKEVAVGGQFIIQEVPDKELAEWAKKVANGFNFPEAEEQFFHYAQAKGVTAFAAYEQENNIIAGATIAMHEDLCDLGVTSTLPIYRGKGLQKQLLRARLHFAKQHGLKLATVTTEPGTISDLNVQKIGFQCAYTRFKMTKLINNRE